MTEYYVQTENGKFRSTARNGFTVHFVAWWIGMKSYFDRDPQRVITYKMDGK